MDLSGTSAIDEALDRVGQLLAARGSSYAIIVLGGAALNLLGIVDRATTDVDILAFADPPEPTRRGTTTAPPRRMHQPPEPIPSSLADSSGPRSVHCLDLIALRPTAKELSEAAEWVRTQDASSEFATILEQVLRHARKDL